MLGSISSHRRLVAVGAGLLTVAAFAAVTLLPGGQAAAPQSSGQLPQSMDVTRSPSGASGIASVMGSDSPGLFSIAPNGTGSVANREFQLIDMFAPMPPQTPPPTTPGQSAQPGQSSAPAQPTSTPRPVPPLVDPGHEKPDQSFSWLVDKASGRIALSVGKIALLPAGTYPLTNVATGADLPAARTLDVTFTRWIVEPVASGTDARGNYYRDLTYWNMCGPGAATVALYYWQMLTGHPDVTTRSGYFVEPYKQVGMGWPNPGPTFRAPSGKYNRLGTYWTGKDSVPGFTARGRGFLMYMATAVQPAGWTVPGVDVFAGGDGKPLYPTRGSQQNDLQAALNWEVSEHASDWTNTWYATVEKWDPTMARDLQTAVMLDLGRDGVPVIVSADTYYLPNWQGSRIKHTRHSVTIVGYDNSANPPTFTYLDTCGQRCNSRPGNGNGKVYKITQAQMVDAVSKDFGMGFIW